MQAAPEEAFINENDFERIQSTFGLDGACILSLTHQVVGSLERDGEEGEEEGEGLPLSPLALPRESGGEDAKLASHDIGSFASPHIGALPPSHNDIAEPPASVSSHLRSIYRRYSSLIQQAGNLNLNARSASHVVDDRTTTASPLPEEDAAGGDTQPLEDEPAPGGDGEAEADAPGIDLERVPTMVDDADEETVSTDATASAASRPSRRRAQKKVEHEYEYEYGEEDEDNEEDDDEEDEDEDDEENEAKRRARRKRGKEKTRGDPARMRRTVSQAGSALFNELLFSLRQQSSDKTKKQGCHFCGQIKADRVVCNNPYCALQGGKTKYMCAACLDHQCRYLGSLGLDPMQLLGDTTSPQWFCPACVMWEDNLLPFPGICCCSFRRMELFCPVHSNEHDFEQAAPSGAAKVFALHCKPYKQKITNLHRMKRLPLELESVRIGSAPFMRRFVSSNDCSSSSSGTGKSGEDAKVKPESLPLPHMWLGCFLQRTSSTGQQQPLPPPPELPTLEDPEEEEEEEARPPSKTSKRRHEERREEEERPEARRNPRASKKARS